ncbi:MAG: hypothetical protein WDW38_002301 [Sanguina aurantia]
MEAGTGALPAPVPKPRPFSIVGTAPGPRCGHTLTSISGPDGDLSKAKLILFGGATALEGSSGKGEATPPASPGPAAASGIRLAGATNDVHIYDVRSGHWGKIQPLGEPPSPRAAHAAAAVGNMVVIQGGIGPAGLATEDLHVLDFTDTERPRWHRVLVQGAGPSARYAHTLSLVANRFLVAMGGNDGKSTLGDAWALDTSEKPYQWRKITEAGEMPSPRMYATAAARGDGLLLLCGGRDAGGTPMGDAYGFARHRDGRWEWHAAPGQMPTGRYQHGAIFVGNRLHISGGAVGGGRMVDEGTSTVVLDTNAGQWVSPAANAGEDFTRRCRHAVASVGPFVFIYGGLKGSQLLEDLLVADDSGGTELTIFDPRSQPWIQWMDATHGNAAASQILDKAAREEAAAAERLQQQALRRSPSGEDLLSREAADAEAALSLRDSGASSAGYRLSESVAGRSESPDLTLGKSPPAGHTPYVTPDVKLWHRAVVVHQENSLRGLVRQLSIDQLDNEGRRVSIYDNHGVATNKEKSPLFTKSCSPHILCMHGGIGRCIHKIEQIAAIQRPVTMEEGGPVLMDLLWSDPTTNDAVVGVQPSPRGPGLVTFGPDRVKEFCKNNNLQMIVRAHECVMDGFERFAQGHLITLFSATNYCGTAGNAGAILVLGRDLVMVPKLIHPLPPSTPHTPDSSLEDDANAHQNDSWMQSINDERPPTPPRGRPHVPGSSLEYF